MRYKCHYCGNPNVLAKDRYCSNCGALQQKRSPASSFLLAILYALFIWGTMFAVQNGIVILYTICVQCFLPYSTYLSETYFDTYWGVFSKYFALISIFSALLLILVYLLFYKLRGKHFTKEISLAKISPSAGGISFALGACTQIIVVVAISLLAILFPAIQEANAANSEYYTLVFGGGSFIMEVICIGIITPILEEIVFRGLIYTRLRRAMPVIAAQILSALIFGAAHMNWMQFVYASLIGFLMALLFEKYQSILPSMLFHIAFNCFSYVAMLIQSDMLAYSLFFISIAIFLFGMYFIFRKESDEAEINANPHSERNPFMKLYNTLTREKEDFVPRQPGKVSMYTCGPTVYHYAHIGNLRTYIMEDVLEKYLRYTGLM